MADYQSLLTRAVANLPVASLEARQGIYERARKALVTQLRSLRPPLPESDIAREETALDKAIAAVEAKFPAEAAQETGAPPPNAGAAPPAEGQPGPDPAPDPRGTVLVVGAGTGLGVAMLSRTAEGARVIETEGGHIDFAPLDSLEDQILARLRAQLNLVVGKIEAELHAWLVNRDGEWIAISTAMPNRSTRSWAKFRVSSRR